jgi:hypothetical protein
MRIVIFFALMGITAAPGLFARTRLFRNLWLALVLLGNVVFGWVLTGSELRADVSQLRLAQPHGQECIESATIPGTIMRNARRRFAAQMSMLFWFGVLAVAPLRRIEDRSSPSPDGTQGAG